MRIGHYEEESRGTHDASKVLTPFLESFLSHRRRQRIAGLLYDAASLNKLSQSVLESARRYPGPRGRRHIFYTADGTRRWLHAVAAPRAPQSPGSIRSARQGIRPCARGAGFRLRCDFRVLGNVSRGRPRQLIPPLISGRMDAYGQRRLSLKDIEASYRLRTTIGAAGAFSYVGSHVLSAAYLMLCGR